MSNQEFTSVKVSDLKIFDDQSGKKTGDKSMGGQDYQDYKSVEDLGLSDMEIKDGEDILQSRSESQQDQFVPNNPYIEVNLPELPMKPEVAVQKEIAEQLNLIAKEEEKQLSKKEQKKRDALAKRIAKQEEKNRKKIEQAAKKQQAKEIGDERDFADSVKKREKKALDKESSSVDNQTTVNPSTHQTALDRKLPRKLQQRMKKVLQHETCPEIFAALQGYVEQGLLIEREETLRAIREAQIKNDLKDNFEQQVQAYNRNPKAIECAELKACDSTALLEYSLEKAATVQDDFKSHLQEFILNLLLKIKRVNYLAAFQYQDRDATGRFLAELFEFINGLDKEIPHTLIYLLAQLDQLPAVIQRVYLDKELQWTHDWKNGINSTWTEPSGKKAHSFEYCLLWGLHTRYENIGTPALFSVFESPLMMMHTSILQDLNGTQNMHQKSAAEIWAKSVTGNTDAHVQFHQFIEILKGRTAILKNLNELQPKDEMMKVNASVYIGVVNALELWHQQSQSKANEWVKKHQTLAECGKHLSEPLNRQHALIRDGLVDSALDAQIDNGSPQLKKAYRYFEKLAMDAPNSSTGKFKPQPLQYYYCAKSAVNESKLVLSVVPPGGGKTFVAMQLARFYLSKGFKVIVLTCNDFLRKQMTDSIWQYLKTYDNITICFETLPDVVEDGTIVIIDEADEWFHSYAARITDGKLRGIFQLKNVAKVHLLTATATDFMTNMVEVLFPDIGGNWREEFQTKIQMQDRALESQTITINCGKNEEDMLAKAYHEMDGIYRKKPIIVFSEHKHQKRFEEFKKRYNNHVAVIRVTKSDQDGALALRHSKASSNTGIYLIDDFYARGYDLKLNAESVVFILADNDRYSHTTITQMVGRACRSFGQSEGKYFSIKLDSKAHLPTALACNEPQILDAHRILAQLFKRWSELTGEEIQRIERMVNNEKFFDTIANFQKTDPAAFGVIWPLGYQGSKEVKKFNAASLFDD